MQKGRLLSVAAGSIGLFLSLAQPVFGGTGVLLDMEYSTSTGFNTLTPLGASQLTQALQGSIAAGRSNDSFYWFGSYNFPNLTVDWTHTGCGYNGWFGTPSNPSFNLSSSCVAPVDNHTGNPLNGTPSTIYECIGALNNGANFFSPETAGDPYPCIKYDWNGTVYAAQPTEPTKLTPVIIIPGIVGSAEYNDIWVIDPITHGFDNLIDTLVANGYTRDDGLNLHPDLFTFPYDWHKSNIDTAVLLKQKIDQVKQICGCDEVDLVAHSMGGLVARQYIQSAYYGHDVRNMIFIGTPHLGAPMAYLMWEGGEMDVDFESQVKLAYLRAEAIENLKLSLFDYIRETPIASIQELLPVFGYIKHTDSPNISTYPNTNWYPSNSFLENLNANVGNLYDSGVIISNYVGVKTGNKTISTIRVIPPSTINAASLWGYGFPDGYPNNGDSGLERGAGDEIVPINSSSFINNNLQTLDANHGDLITAAEGDIFEQLTGKVAATLVHKTYGNLDSIASMIMFHIHSPADIMVIAPDGKREGKDFATGEVFNEIPGGFYSGYRTNNEYITVPNPIGGEYKLITQGTGTGKYTLVADTITSATSSEASFVGQTTPGLITAHDIDVDMTNPSGTLIAPEDQSPPTITFNQPATTTYTHADFLPVNVSFADATGVASGSVGFDNRAILASTTIDLFYETLGTHTISASSTDLVNNATSSRETIRVMATASSTVSDVQREYSLGWIKSITLRDLLIKKLNTSVKLQKITDTIVVSTKPLVTKKVDRWVQFLDTIILKSMLLDLTLAKATNQINAQGYQTLVADINWLLSH